MMRVHRVNDDRLHPRLVAARSTLPQHAVHDGYDVAQALSGPGSRGEHIARPTPGDLDGLPLVLMQIDNLTRRSVGLLLLADAEDPFALRVQEPLFNQFADRSARGKVGVERQVGVRPLVPLGHALLDMLPDSRIVDLGETCRERLVVREQLPVDLEDVHACVTLRDLAPPGRLLVSCAAGFLCLHHKCVPCDFVLAPGCSGLGLPVH